MQILPEKTSSKQRSTVPRKAPSSPEKFTRKKEAIGIEIKKKEEGLSAGRLPGGLRKTHETPPGFSRKADCCRDGKRGRQKRGGY